VAATSLFEGLLRFFYPGTCPACLAASESNVLCPDCARLVPGAAGLEPPAILGGRAALAASRYEGVTRDLILRLKFARETHPAAALGAILASALAASGFARDADAVVPMPLSRRRLRERGFNQAERIGAVVAARLGLPLIERLLLRTVHRPPQADLGAAERAGNVRGVFRGGDGAFGRAILLVDDVITTGHTIAEAAGALDAAGARRVLVCAVAASGWDAAGPAPLGFKSASTAPGTP
jgi:ComF family protein